MPPVHIRLLVITFEKSDSLGNLINGDELILKKSSFEFLHYLFLKQVPWANQLFKPLSLNSLVIICGSCKEPLLLPAKENHHLSSFSLLCQRK